MFWVGLIIVVIVAAVPRLLSYNFSLPYVDHIDEPTLYLQALQWRGLYDRGFNYPPGYIVLQFAAQLILEPLGIQGLGPTLQVMRLLSVAFNLLTVVFVTLTARLAGGDLAGLLAGLAWGTSPLLLENGVYALANPLVYLLVAVALWLAATALLDQRRQAWCIGSVAVGLFAALAAYRAVPAIGPGVVAALAMWAKDRRRGLRYLAVEVALVAGAAGFVYWYAIFRAQALTPVLGKVEEGIENLPNFSRIVSNIYYATLPLGSDIVAITIVLGIVAYLVARRRGLPCVRVEVVGLALLLLVTIPWLAAGWHQVSVDNRLRDVLPATSAVCVILGVAVAQIMNILPPRWPVLRRVTPVIALALVFFPHVEVDWKIVQERQLPDRRVALRQWADVNLEPGTVLVTGENHKTFNPFWGGIPYRHWFDWWVTDNLMEYSLQEWREERGMSYAVIPLWQWREMQKDEAGRAYLAEMLHLRDFIEPEAQRGPQMRVYRLWRMETQTEVQFGDYIRLVGYDLDGDGLAPGANLSFRFYWQATSTPPENYSLYVHLARLTERDVLAQVDGAPAVPERPTQTWNEPSESLISPRFELRVPPDLPEGEYRVLIGLYNYMTGERLPVTSADGNALGDAYWLCCETASLRLR